MVVDTVGSAQQEDRLAGNSKELAKLLHFQSIRLD
jgi:hypothetical protein